jgi:HSP20 family protein
MKGGNETMYLMKQDPSFSLPTFQGLQRELNRLFDEASRGFDPSLGVQTGVPPVEIYETDQDLVILAELPDFEKKDVNISFDGGQLKLSGERKVAEAEDRNYHRNERWYGRFERSFQVPVAFDAANIKAQLQNGILTVTLPKKEDAKPRQIAISSS